MPSTGAQMIYNLFYDRYSVAFNSFVVLSDVVINKPCNLKIFKFYLTFT